MVTLNQAEERLRKDLKQVADYAQAMMEKEFPSMDFPGEKWYRADGTGVIVYIAFWPSGDGIGIRIRITQDVSDPSLWEIYCGSVNRQPSRFEKRLDLLSVRCIAVEWMKHLTGENNGN